MSRRRRIQSKNDSTIKKISRRGIGTIQQRSLATIPIVKHTLPDNLDDETKLAKRHLAKEMWQLVSIAVKRMTDELVSITNSHQVPTSMISREPQTLTKPNNYELVLGETENTHPQSSSLPITGRTMIANAGAGDVSSVKEKPAISKEYIKKRTLPSQMLESSSYIKRRVTSNNATHRTTKSKVQNKSSKKEEKVATQHPHNNYKLK